MAKVTKASKNRKIRVLQLTLNYNPVLTRYLEDVAGGFIGDDRFEFDYGVLEGDPSKELETRLECPVIWFRMRHRQVEKPTVSGLFRLWRHIRNKNYDIVITHRHKPARMMALIKPFLKLRGVISVWHDVGQFKRKGRALLARWLMQKDWRHIGVSEAVSEDLGRTGPAPEHVVTIHNSVDIEAIREGALSRQDARKALDIPAERYLIGTLGQTATRKGHKYLLAAMPAILRRIPEAHLVILGGGDQDENLAHQVRTLGLEEKVTLTGSVRDGYRYLSALDLYVMPSLREAFGISLIEAMALGLPVIGSDINGIPEVIGNSRLLFPPGNDEVIAESVIWFHGLSEEEKMKLCKETLTRVETLFGSAQHKERYRNLVLEFFD